MSGIPPRARFARSTSTSIVSPDSVPHDGHVYGAITVSTFACPPKFSTMLSWSTKNVGHPSTCRSVIVFGSASIDFSHCRTPNDVIRVILATLMTTVFIDARLPNPLKFSSTRPDTWTSAASPAVTISTAAPARGLSLADFAFRDMSR